MKPVLFATALALLGAAATTAQGRALPPRPLIPSWCACPTRWL
ncbi:MAG: hypothetical protein WKG07_34220 [Hymenobacter sp.]